MGYLIVIGRSYAFFINCYALLDEKLLISIKAISLHEVENCTFGNFASTVNTLIDYNPELAYKNDEACNTCRGIYLVV